MDDFRLVWRQLLTCTLLMLTSLITHAMQKLSDDQMSQVTGKEFLTLTTVGTNDLGNPNENVAFYRVGMNAQIDINTNINALRLGCDSPNTSQDCDISIDNLALTGHVPSVSIDGNPDTPRFASVEEKFARTKQIQSLFFSPKDAGPVTDFVLNRPFFELAIQHPESLTDRKVVGYRFGAQEVWGTMSTGAAPLIAGTNLASPVEIYGPTEKNYGVGQDALTNLWNDLKNNSAYGNNQDERFEVFKDLIIASALRGHTGVNRISGRLPVRLDNINIRATAYEVPVIGVSSAQIAILSGRLSRLDATDYGIDDADPTPLLGIDNQDYQSGYLRNIYIGDRDTLYDARRTGNYLANDNRVGRASELKRANGLVLDNLVVRIHSTPGTIGEGDRFTAQTVSVKALHALTYGEDLNNNLRYDEGEGSKHLAFQYQSLDGLQWLSTNKRFSTAYDDLGNPIGEILNFNNAQGYDWLSTRAGWWIESPIATVRNGYVPLGQAVTKGVPSKTDVVTLGTLDIGLRPVDNCYGELTFC